LGFEGKWAIHPNQVELCKKVYTPLKEEIEMAKRIVDAYEDPVNLFINLKLWDSRAESPFNPASTKMVIRKLTGSKVLIKPSFPALDYSAHG
jgi:hypothetical protein